MNWCPILLVILAGVPADLEGGKVTRLGSKLRLDLVNYSTTWIHLPHPLPRPTEPLQSDVVEAVRRAAFNNGLSLNTSTATDGNCGIDAILRGLERFDAPTTAECREVLATLHTKGRAAALAHLRKMLVKWIRRNRAVALQHDFSIEQLVGMEHSSFAEYCDSMEQDGVWIDTVVLIAASDVLRIQLVVLLGNCEPQLVASPHVQNLETAPVVSLANVGNFHFFACEATDVCKPGAVNFSRDEAGWAEQLALDPLVLDCEDEDAEDAAASDIQGSDVAPPSSTDPIFSAATSIGTWDPWGFAPPGPEIKSLLESWKDSNTPHVDTLRCRAAFKLLEEESREEMDKRWVYERGRLWAAAKGHTRLDHKTFRKSSKLARLFDAVKVIRNLSEPCSTGGSPHTCLNEFRASPQALINWRRLFYTLPQHDRFVRLVNMLLEQTAPDAAHGSTKGVKGCLGNAHPAPGWGGMDVGWG